MTQVRMKAIDTLFVSSWSSENIPPNGEFVVSEERAKQLEAAGLAKRVGAAKQAAAPANKAARPHPNKASPRGRQSKKG